MHAGDEIPAKLEHVAEAPPGRLAAGPTRAGLEDAPCRPLDGEPIGFLDIHERLGQVLHAFDRAGKTRQRLSKRLLPSSDAELGEIDLRILGEEIQKRPERRTPKVSGSPATRSTVS